VNIVLIGFTSCGKSATGKALADRLDHAFVDLDTCIETLHTQATGRHMACREIFDEVGEESFEQLETQALDELDRRAHFVLSTGGRTPLAPQNRTHLKAIGSVVYLRADTETIYVRMGGKGLPVYMRGDPTLQNLTMIWQERDPVYREMADLIVDNSELAVDETVDRIVDHFHFETQ